MISLYKDYGDSALLVLIGTSLNAVNALVVHSRRFMLTPTHFPHIYDVTSCMFFLGGGGWGELNMKDIKLYFFSKIDDQCVTDPIYKSQTCTKPY